VALLTVLAVELASRASADVLRTGRASRDAAFRRLADSGAEVARGLLLEREPREYVYWGEAWNQDIAVRLAEEERADVRLADESGKIWLGGSKAEERGVARARSVRLFEYLKRRNPRRLKAMRDVEAKMLQRLAARVPLVTLDGLREAGLSMEDVFGPDGLHRYFTCFGDGTVNLNTAPRAVLFALDEEFDEAQVEKVAAFRGKGEGERGIYKAFPEIKDLMLVDGIVVRTFENGEFRVARNLFDRVQGFISVTSSAFSARVSAEVLGYRRETWIFLKPDSTRLAVEEIVP
jgi:type II secretory pathway component PulK